MKHRVERLQVRAQQLFGQDGGEDFRLQLEAELVSARREGFLEGKRDGFNTARAVGQGPAVAPRPRSHTPRQPFAASDSQKTTPLHPTDWYEQRPPVKR